MFRDAVLAIDDPELLCDGVDCVDGGLGARPGLENASDEYCVAAADSDMFCNVLCDVFWRTEKNVSVLFQK